MNMAAENQQLHVVFFPFLAHGHMIPTLDIVRLFASYGVRVTIITTPLNAPIFNKAVETAKKMGTWVIDVELFRFPAEEAGLPEGFENIELVKGDGMIVKFIAATELLREQLEPYLQKTRPNCLVADMFFPWATECAAKFDIPRLVFHGTNFFYLCASEIIRLYEPYKNVSSDEEPFALPFLPHQTQMTRLQLPEDLWKYAESDFKRRIALIHESEVKSYGVIVNSFYELEPDYADFFGKELGRRAWHIGPASLCNRSIENMVQGQKLPELDQHECLKWLNSRKPNSVIYICFGSTAHIIGPQLHEIAVALQASEQAFIWVVKNEDYEKSAEWLPTGFEKRLEERGLIIKGWAPQMLILEHEAVGAFVSHCGWNSILEGISAGVPVVTWPLFAEQFYNEKFVTQILKIGVPVGSKKWGIVTTTEYMVKWDSIEKALREIMGGEEAEEVRNRAKTLKEIAWKAVEEGGSSYSDLSALINELRVYRA